MKIISVWKGEISCRICENFKHTNTCWKIIKGNGEYCKKFKGKDRETKEVDNGK